MKNHNHSNPFYKDERLKNMSPERLELLMNLANELSEAPQNQKTNKFLSIMQNMSKNNVSFSTEEQQVLFSILTENMSPEEKKKAEMIRRLASQFRRTSH